METIVISSSKYIHLGACLNIYSSDNYRGIINETMSEKKFLDKTFSFQSMSSFIRVQKPYLSKVMNSRADFNSDQLFMSCKYLEMTEEETNYMLLLLEYDRCNYSERKKTLLIKIQKIQDSKRDSKTILINNIKTRDALDFDESIHIEYYLDPIILIVHMFLTIPRFRKNIDRIAIELFLSKDHLNEILKKLVEMSIIEINEGKIEVLIKTMHLPRESKVVSSHQQMMKQYALYRMNRIGVEYKKNFSVTFSSNEDSRKKIELEFNKFLSKVREISMEGDKKDCYQLNFDLFPWSLPS